MSFNPWTQQSGYTLGSFVQAKTVTIPLPVNQQTNVVYSVISGTLPDGLAVRYENNSWKILGTPFLTTNNTKFTFCIRATQGSSISDRTFTMFVYTTDLPEFITPEGELPIGFGGQYYVLDSTYVSYQIEAYDFNTSTGKPLTYFIADGDGSLPPGLSLSTTGVIEGFIQPQLVITKADGSGTFDASQFDRVAFDFGQLPTDGFDSYQYDDVFYDFNVESNQPVSLSANYQFRVTLSDGVNLTQRIFRIFVAGSDEFHADSTILDGMAGDFLASSSYVRTPVWITNSYLGAFRANNYITLPIALYDASNVEFSIVDSTKLPPGMLFDPNTGDVYGTVPYQPSVTKTYSFTIQATRLDGNESVTAEKTFTIVILGLVNSEITWNTNSNLGSIPADYVCTLSVNASTSVPDAVVSYTITSGSLPNGLSLNLDGEIIGIPNQYYDAATGELGLTTFDLGYNKQNNISTSTTFDHSTTTFERVFTFGITASDQYGYGATERIFTLHIDEVNKVHYSNIVTKPMLVPSQRILWQDFINNTSIFTPSSIYRPNDSNFGLQTGLTMLVYAGIQTEQAAAYVSAIGLNHKRKRFQFGSLKKAVAVDPVTENPVYEVIYIQMIDPMEPNGKHLPSSITVKNNNPKTVTVDIGTTPSMPFTIDSTGYKVSTPNVNTYYPNSISNWRERISETIDSTTGTADTERNYLPLWMRSFTTSQKEQIGYIPCIPLCFCKIGTADTILLNIKFSGFDFKLLDYTVDRYIVNAVLNSQGDILHNDKYLVFKNDRITV